MSDMEAFPLNTASASSGAMYATTGTMSAISPRSHRSSRVGLHGKRQSTPSSLAWSKMYPAILCRGMFAVSGIGRL